MNFENSAASSKINNMRINFVNLGRNDYCNASLEELAGLQCLMKSLFAYMNIFIIKGFLNDVNNLYCNHHVPIFMINFK